MDSVEGEAEEAYVVQNQQHDVAEVDEVEGGQELGRDH